MELLHPLQSDMSLGSVYCPPALLVHQVRLSNVTYEVPERYKPIKLIGSGAYGQVWYVNLTSALV